MKTRRVRGKLVVHPVILSNRDRDAVDVNVCIIKTNLQKWEFNDIADEAVEKWNSEAKDSIVGYIQAALKKKKAGTIDCFHTDVWAVDI